jgi:hypothetical protein
MALSAFSISLTEVATFSTLYADDALLLRISGVTLLENNPLSPKPNIKSTSPRPILFIPGILEIPTDFWR